MHAAGDVPSTLCPYDEEWLMSFWTGMWLLPLPAWKKEEAGQGSAHNDARSWGRTLFLICSSDGSILIGLISET